MIAECFAMAFQNLRSSKMRSFLTMLGIVIGIASVMVIIGLGNGMQQYMTDQFKAIGTNTLSVMITGRGSAKTLPAEEMFRIVDEDPDLELLSPTTSMRGGVKIGTESLSSTSVTGVSVLVPMALN